MTKNKSETVSPRPVDETIAAISTPPGHGALGIIRISGPLTSTIIQKYCRIGRDQVPDFETNPRKQIYSRFLDSTGIVLDDVLFTYFPEGKSYTGEESCEISFHGNPILLRKALHQITLEPGVRPADPGEFTRRAFLNGRMDLSQAESVKRLIDARSEFELESGRRMLDGELSRKVSHFRHEIIGLRAETAAEVDFPEEDLTFESRELRIQKVNKLIKEMQSILDNSDAALRVTGGFQIVLAGIPNAGKSSILNHLLGWDRAIVSPAAGTTRDYIAETISIAGVEVRIVDTAGLRESQDQIEAEGVRRSIEEIDRSQLVLHIVDGSVPEYKLFDLQTHGRILRVINKCDVLHQEWGDIRASADPSEILFLSSLTGEGIPELKKQIESFVGEGSEGVDPFLLEERQKHHFQRIVENLETVLSLWETGAPDEIVAIELDQAVEHTGKISGEITTEEVLGRIFSEFCVGK